MQEDFTWLMVQLLKSLLNRVILFGGIYKFLNSIYMGGLIILVYIPKINYSPAHQFSPLATLGLSDTHEK